MKYILLILMAPFLAVSITFVLYLLYYTFCINLVVDYVKSKLK